MSEVLSIRDSQFDHARILEAVRRSRERDRELGRRVIVAQHARGDLARAGRRETQIPRKRWRWLTWWR